MGQRWRLPLNVSFPLWAPGGTLAHAFLPRRGEAHFDGAERWSLRGYKGHSLLMVAAHEIGHTLGLGHSPVRHALMAPTYRRLGRSPALSWDDVRAVQQLYGKIHTTPPTSILVRTFSPPLYPRGGQAEARGPRVAPPLIQCGPRSQVITWRWIS